jgi:hypothetical protein
VDLSLLKHKADRSFCEALLSRFSIEVRVRVRVIRVRVRVRVRVIRG